MAMVSMLGGNRLGGAVIYDDAGRFGRTMNAMMRKLNESWPSDSAKPVATARASASQPLRRTSFPDGSGSIGLPAGWRMTGSGGGAVWASGPNGESVSLAVHCQIYDPSWIQYLTAGGRPVPPGTTIYRYRGDLVAAWLAAEQQNSQRQHLPIPTFIVTSSRKLPLNPGEEDSVLVNGELDYHDGKGPLVSKIQLAKGSSASGSWGMSLHRLSAPKRLANEEWATLTAIAGSLNQDQRTLDIQVQAKLGEIHDIGERARQQAADADARREASRRSFENRWDDLAKGYQAFQNYQFDRSVVQDNETGEHGTLSYPTADWLVKQDPNRFQLVATPDFLKGIDY